MSGAPRLVHTFQRVDSTNERALALAAAGADDGTVVIAAEQTAGRGRRGRDWHSPEGGLYLSYVVRDVEALRSPPLLTLAAGVAVIDAVGEATGLRAELKWPNDVVTGDPPRKVAGILAEASGSGNRLEVAVIGVGINVSTPSFPAAIAARASSLAIELGREVDRGALQAALIAAIDRQVARLRAGEDAAMLEDWSAAAPASRGRDVSWLSPEGEKRGTTAGVDEEGALLVRTSDGVERLVAGEVIWA